MRVRNEPIFANCGPPEPINDRIRLKLLVSDEIKRRRGLGTSQDRIEKRIESLSLNR